MRIVTWNIQFARGRDRRCDPARIAAVVRDADIVALQEVDRYWTRSGDTDQPALLAELLPDHYWVYGPAVDVLKQPAPGPRGAVRRQFGNMLLSRHPILSTRNVLLPRAALQRVKTMQRSALEATISLPAGQLIRVVSTHLDHVSSALRVEQVQALLDLHRQAPLQGGAEHGDHPDRDWTEAIMAPLPPPDTLLLGDFNMEPTSPEYTAMVGDTHPRWGRLNRLDGFADAWVLAGHDEREGVTIYRDLARGTGLRVDYAFVSAGLAPFVRAATLDADTRASDHQPLWIDLEIHETGAL